MARKLDLYRGSSSCGWRRTRRCRRGACSRRFQKGGLRRRLQLGLRPRPLGASAGGGGGGGFGSRRCLVARVRWTSACSASRGVAGTRWVVVGLSWLLWACFYASQTMAVLTADWSARLRLSAGAGRAAVRPGARRRRFSDDRMAGGGGVLNAEFLRFAGHWGSRRACRPHRIQTKARWAAHPLAARELPLRPQVPR